MKNPESVLLINEIYNALEFLNVNTTDKPYRDMVYKLAAEGERRHRKGYFARRKYALSVDAAAKYFAVKWIMRIGAGTRDVTVASLLELRPDAQLGAMVAAQYWSEILDATTALDIDSFRSLDYTRLCEGEQS